MLILRLLALVGLLAGLLLVLAIPSDVTFPSALGSLPCFQLFVSLFLGQGLVGSSCAAIHFEFVISDGGGRKDSRGWYQSSIRLVLY